VTPTPAIDVYGVDFTSRPTRSKPITHCCATYDGAVLAIREVRSLLDFDAFEDALAQPGPWVAGMDFPFGQSRKLVTNLGWPATWSGYMQSVAAMTRDEFVALLEAYKAPRPAGDREHPRGVDRRAGSISPQKLYGVPVAKMFFEGATRLWRSGAHIVPVRPAADPRTVVEAYPALVARRFVRRSSYKSDTTAKRSGAHRRVRRGIVDALRSPRCREAFGFDLTIRRGWLAPIVDDASGDRLDAVLCAVQAAWSWSLRERGFGVPPQADRLEGWIVDPGLL
jgi:hypothetical protein